MGYMDMFEAWIKMVNMKELPYYSTFWIICDFSSKMFYSPSKYEAYYCWKRTPLSKTNSICVARPISNLYAAHTYVWWCCFIEIEAKSLIYKHYKIKWLWLIWPISYLMVCISLIQSFRFLLTLLNQREAEILKSMDI